MGRNITGHRHAHAYVYRFLVPATEGGVTTIDYTLLTDTDGPRNPRNREALESALRVAYGYRPKGVRYLCERV